VVEASGKPDFSLGPWLVPGAATLRGEGRVLTNLRPQGENMVQYGFHHENLDCYRLAVEVALWVAKAPFGPGFTALRDQGIRASQSVVLNIAEGCARGGGAERNHFRIAQGSAAETCAVLDLFPASQGVNREALQEQQQKLRRIGAMLHRLAR